MTADRLAASELVAPLETTEVVETARAKVNLALHVTGQREDGYHTLDSLVVFPAYGDEITLRPADDMTLSISGPYAEPLNTDRSTNLVMKAAWLMSESVPGARSAHIQLTKRLPVAAGIGGGSADAAATLRALGRLWDVHPSSHNLEKLALRLGADVPMCFGENPSRVRGIGEQIEKLSAVPKGALVLVNPGIELSTPSVFQALENKQNSPLPTLPDKWSGPQEFASWLRACRNDLQAPATSLVPQIGDVLSLLDAQTETLLSRMSGSGPTCFALCATLGEAQAVAKRIKENRPDWWVQSAAY
ncbi:4-(cytidine 5'-diphospho)-2-C-methyl-D-erythritol kinase [Pseudovibrio sp. SPO723]|uniref:4-(cytidine 5'-diphospho)-2-C-methyl-D-erythritol kinase n=1 Tax=Nesiotobacter zosterae TaxID=392721 RepID=UPI0029C28501|nr:4-(cytidine 5'-diphospho)-2-C-methyl-D-erythritol kinase [Pseudovibrio sp. SPO723]MDX5594642.1 4-(cytidine 5'-diphospho)-2-C-methyl-D-erythritol kinase [Pseudovibrio sp. SPO723]